MPNNMPDTRAIHEALRRAREMQARSAPAPQPPEPPAPEPKPEPAQHETKPAEKAVSGQGSLLDGLLKDRERTLILALLILLSGEGGSTELLFALMYLLI